MPHSSTSIGFCPTQIIHWASSFFYPNLRIDHLNVCHASKIVFISANYLLYLQWNMSTVTDISMFFKSEFHISIYFWKLPKNFFNFYRSEINVKSTHSTLVCWLQNDQGYQMYKPTDTAIDAFLESYRPGKDKNIEAAVAENSVTNNSASVTSSNATETNNKSV